MVQDFTKLTWQDGVANPALSAANMQRYDDAIDTIADSVRFTPIKRVRAATAGSNITTSGVRTIDDIACSVGDRVLLKNQTTPANNGIYVVATGSWSRATDANEPTEFAGGTMIAVEQGTVNGGKVFRVTNSEAVVLNTTALTFAEVGAGGSGGTGGYTTDGTTPLKYSTFLAAAAGNETAALQNAINALSDVSPPEFSRYLDLEGAQINLTNPIVLPSASIDHITSVYNGELKAASNFAGTHLIDGSTAGSLQYRFMNVTFNGNMTTSWAKWTNGNLMFFDCHLYYPGPNGATNPGLKAENQATFYIRHCRFWSGDGNINPDLRGRVAVHAVGDNAGDQKISSSVFAHFKHAIIYDAFVLLMTDCHIYQGNQGDTSTPTYTAGIKFTRATFGSAIVNLYLDKCFIELSNETKPGTAQIGGIHIIGVKTLSVVQDADFAYIRVRDYHGQSNMVVSNVILMGCQFSQDGSPAPKIRATALHNPASFDTTNYDGIYMKGNTFTNVNPQANPVTVKRETTTGVDVGVNFDTLLPFGGSPKEVLNLVARRQSGTRAAVEMGGIAGKVVTVSTGQATFNGWFNVTATCNTPGAITNSVRFVE